MSGLGRLIGNEKTVLAFEFLIFLSPPSVRPPDLEWYEESEETHAPQIELLETTPAQEPPNPSESFCPRDCLVPVVFPGPVSREGCCRFTCELLKHVMYQRQQLPLPYEQLKHFYCKPSSQVGTGGSRCETLWLLDGSQVKRKSRESPGPSA